MATATQGSASPERTQRAATEPAPAKRKRKATVTTAPRLQAKTLLASTRDELRHIQEDLLELAEARRTLLALDTMSENSTLQLLPPKL